MGEREVSLYPERVGRGVDRARFAFEKIFLLKILDGRQDRKEPGSELGTGLVGTRACTCTHRHLSHAEGGWWGPQEYFWDRIRF